MRVGSFLAMMMCSLSCILVEDEPIVMEPVEKADVSVKFYAEPTAAVKSSIAPQENMVRNLNVYAFREGVLADEVYVSDGTAAILNLAAGYIYDIYAVANMGNMPADVDEQQFYEDFSYSIDSLSDISETMPMFCQYGRLYVTGNSQVIQLNMQRLVSKLSLKVDKDALLEGLQVSSVRLCQTPSIVRPFKWFGDGGSRAMSECEVIDGDFATSDDLIRINSGEEAFFYSLENCQGMLLQDNTFPFQKVPDNLGYMESLCTYLEVGCVFGPEGMLEGEVSYRVYLGLDAVSSFDVPGNSCINVTMKLTDDGLRRVSWKVDADVSVRDGYVHGYVSEGMHRMNELYVGEKLLYEIVLADELLEYLGGKASECRLAFLGSGGECEHVVVEDLYADGNVLTAELLCRKPFSGELYLYDSRGEVIGRLESDVTVKLPHMVYAEYESWLDSDPVEWITYMPECDVNGRGAEFYLYLVDDEGYNLNGPLSYGYDASLFDFQDGGAVSGTGKVISIWTELESLDGGEPGAAAAKVSVFCENDGSNRILNVLLSDIYHGEKNLKVTVRDMCFNISKALSVGIGIPQITLVLVDNGWAGYHDSQLSMAVLNPSNLPLEVSVWQLIATNNKAGSSDNAYVEANLTMDRIEYMTGEFFNGDPALYGSSSSFICERNAHGSPALADGRMLVYPLNGISTTDLIKAIRYDKLGNNQMMHMIDVTMNTQKIKAEDVELQDKVSNGTATYDYMYYSADAWNYRGAGLSCGGENISFSGRWAYDYPYVSAHSLTRMFERYQAGAPVCVTMDYNLDFDALEISAQSGKGAQYGLTVSIRYEGVVNGYVQTHPKGTWYSAQDNYCSIDIGYDVQGVALKANTPEIWADEGKIDASVRRIYEFSYKDSPRPLGSDSYMHHAHPVDLNLDVSFSLEGNQKKELYPVSVDWNFESIPYYHQQEDKDYNCMVNADYKGFEMVVVNHK